MTPRSLAVLAVAACAPSREAPSVPPSHRPPAVDVAAMLARAEQAHAAHLALDYQRPFERADVGDSPAAALYLDACRAGTKQACWVAMQIAAQDVVVRAPNVHKPAQAPTLWREAAKLVEANCLAGDHASCLALPGADDAFGVAFASAPGAAGRSLPCRQFEASCSEPAVRKECEAGFATSCRALASVLALQALDTNKPGVQQASDAARQRSGQLAVTGCRERIVDDCIHAAQDPRAEVRFEAVESWCKLGRVCSGLADAYLERGDAMRARDAAERGCQFFLDRCAELGVLYLDGTFPEPVPGRGQQLVDFVCESVRSKSGADAMRAYKPCARAKLPAR